MFKNLCLLLILSVVMFSCNKEDDNPSPDKEVRVIFPFDYWGPFPIQNNQFHLPPSYTHLVKFNKKNYSNLNSIILYASVTTYEPGDTVEIDLYNVTDNLPISNSAVRVTTLTDDFKTINTSNILNEFPEKEIDLAVRLKSYKTKEVQVRTPYLILKRN